MRRYLTALAVAGIGLAAADARAQSHTVTLCGGSPGGLWSLLAAGLDSAMKAEFPGSTVTYQTSGGGYANVGLVEQGTCDVGLIYDSEAKQAVEGAGPFTAPHPDLRQVVYLYDWAPFHWMMSEDFAAEHGIDSIADIAAAEPPLRLILQRRGLFLSPMGEDMLAAAGTTLDDVEAWGGSVTFAGSSTYAELMANRRGDLVGNSMFIGHSSITQPAQAVPMKLLSVPADIAEQMRAKWGTPPAVIEAGAYPWVEADVPTVTTAAGVFATTDTDPEIVRALALAAARHTDELGAVHAAMREITPEFLTEHVILDYHPAALEAYAEAGLAN